MHQESPYKRQKRGGMGPEGSPSKEQVELTKKYGIGAKLLAQMGFTPGKGQGLGSGGRGIDVPIEVQQRAPGHGGLGMLSVASRLNDVYSDESGSEPSSTDDEEEKKERESHRQVSVKARKNVTFNKVGTETLDAPERRRIISAIRDLQLEADPSITEAVSSSLSWVNQPLEITRDKKRELLQIVNDLGTVNRQLSTLSHSIPILRRKKQDLDEFSLLVKQVDQYLTGRGPGIIHNDIRGLNESVINPILSLSDDGKVDDLLSIIIRQIFLHDNNTLELSAFQSFINPIIEILQYRLPTVPETRTRRPRLNKVQTTVFEIVYPRLMPIWNSLDLDIKQKSSFKLENNVISTLLNYEPILQYIQCYDYIIETYITPQILKRIEKINFLQWNADNYVNWLLECMIILPSDAVAVIKEIIHSKFIDYCENWSINEHVPLPTETIATIKKIVGEKIFFDITRAVFIDTIIKRLLEKYFDLVYDLEHFDARTELIPYGNIIDEDNIDSIYVYRFIRNNDMMFDPPAYRVLIKFIFNEINKFIFDWLNYSIDDKMNDRCKNWFNWFLNIIYDTKLPNPLEVEEINRTMALFEMENLQPIHTETNNNIYDNLKQNPHEDDDLIEIDPPEENSTRSQYSITSIPMRKVTCSFKDVLEDYCQERGYILEKLSHKYAQLSYSSEDRDNISGSNSHVNNNLVPVFQITSLGNGSRKKNVAIKDDILWVENNGGTYIPMYLNQLKL